MAHRRGNWRGYLFVAAATLYLAVFSLLPIALACWMALHGWHLLKVERPFVGLANFSRIAGDADFRNAVLNTLVFVGWSVPLAVITSLAVALLVAQPLRGVGFFRTLFYVPAVASQVALSMVWSWLFMPRTGPVNLLLGSLNDALQVCEVGLSRLGLPAHGALGRFPTDIDYLQTPGWAMAAIIALFLWIGLGPRMVIFVAGLQAVPQQLYEAAALDGAGRWRRFRYVTLPQLLPTTLFVVVTTTIAAFQIFTPVYVLTKGGPQRTTDVVLHHIYNEAWQKLEVGTASAMSLALLAMIGVVSVVQLWTMRRGLTEEATP